MSFYKIDLNVEQTSWRGVFFVLMKSLLVSMPSRALGPTPPSPPPPLPSPRSAPVLRQGRNVSADAWASLRRSSGPSALQSQGPSFCGATDSG